MGIQQQQQKQKSLKSHYRDTCTFMFTTALFTTTRKYNKAAWSSVGWVRKICYIVTMEFYSDLKKKLNHTTTKIWNGKFLLH